MAVGINTVRAKTLLCALAALSSAAAVAEDFIPRSVSLSGSISLTSDYVHRGLSQTAGQPSVQGELHVRSELGWSAGVRASSIERRPGGETQSEIDLQVAHAWWVSPEWNLLLSANHYFYPGDQASRAYEYDELAASLTYQNWLTATATWSPNTPRIENTLMVRNQTARSYELTALRALSSSWSMFAGAGHYDLSELFGTGYWYWNAGFTYTLGNLQMDLSHIDTDHTAHRLFAAEAGKHRWIAALSWRF